MFDRICGNEGAEGAHHLLCEADVVGLQVEWLAWACERDTGTRGGEGVFEAIMQVTESLEFKQNENVVWVLPARM